MSKKIATREAYGKALAELAKENENVVVLDADLSKSTKTADFKAVCPERFFNMGIAEGNMMGVAAGLSTCGKIPFVSTFAMFAAGRAFEQIRNSICYPKLNVKVCATHAGLTVGEDGASHQTVEDLSLMRSIPNMVVISPADAVETIAAIKAIAKYEGPCYVRLGRAAVNVINDENTYEFKLGKGVVFLANVVDGKIVFVCKQNDKFNAGSLVKLAAVITGGNGGGKPDIAQAGGKDVTKLDEALLAVKKELN